MKSYEKPNPMVDKKEFELLNTLTEEYEKLCQPSRTMKLVENISSNLPESVKKLPSKAIEYLPKSIKQIPQTLSDQELFMQTVKTIIESYGKIQEQASKYTISQHRIVKNVSKKLSTNEIESFEELCLVRSYIISSSVNTYKSRNMIEAFTEGAGTGFFGFTGIPFNLALSNFIFFRAVQEIAMFYGYNVRNDDSEMVIAGEVFAQAMNPGKSSGGELGSDIIKVLTMTKLTGTKQAAKTWAVMIEKGGLPLVLTQIRATANKAAEKALAKAGTKGLEFGVFKETFEQIGRRITLNVIKKGIPVISAGISAIIDTGQMKKIEDFADIFYHKRFIMEKESRINLLVDD